ncbi:hypothetical protein [Sinorhizobium meliloti]|uniref:hypothetical protein n=1 Tax=Rhizobium meliloti TaxID=382 RepID=UPI001294AF37|nr:hypothetical protein [Sinorhizobium meliloti]MQU69073.1 hypothetical protein [Sinorhizobium meliloti]
MANKIDLPTDHELAKVMIASQAKERGALGDFFGTKDHAPTNITSVAVVMLIALLAALFFFPLQAGIDRGSVVTALLSAITFTLGLLFGKSS